ncbi:hypothetical protein KJ644_03735 [Candidatus Dependentiae bacterium]|nr:hypothetical protein [Candidatus Dependentiae bacterium]MBU4387555.1 hypothetical protein [Candidatus Dependentiae bacterium]MCG2756630.1 hypothetical protein [Candidatus Dependentiae bacterium]
MYLISIKKLLLIILLFTVKISAVTDLLFDVNASNIQNDKIKCLILLVGEEPINPDIKAQISKFCQTIEYDIKFSDQIETELKKAKTLPLDQTEKNLFENGTSLCLYIKDKNLNTKEIELKNLSNLTTIYKKDYEFKKENLIKTAHKIAADTLPLLTGEQSISQYYIAYSKMISNTQKNICIADYSCNFENTIISNNKINVAPSWHTKLPIIYYSQFDTKKINLKSFNLKNKNNNLICAYEGLNMQPSFSKDGSKVSLCLSGGRNSEIYLYDTQVNKKFNKTVFKKMTNNKGTNVSPCLLENDNLIFCSDYETGLPQIYILDKKENTTKRLTNGQGYCAAPSYCEKNNSIVYSRQVDGIFQLFTLNINDKVEKQITFNFGNKHEPDFSPCGNYILFAYDFEYTKGRQTQQIAVLNINSGKIRVLTQSHAPKNYPKWSKSPISV